MAKEKSASTLHSPFPQLERKKIEGPRFDRCFSRLHGKFGHPFRKGIFYQSPRDPVMSFTANLMRRLPGQGVSLPGNSQGSEQRRSCRRLGTTYSRGSRRRLRHVIRADVESFDAGASCQETGQDQGLHHQTTPVFGFKEIRTGSTVII